MDDYKQYVSNNEIQEEILYIKGERQWKI
jgi:hypothetical protein